MKNLWITCAVVAGLFAFPAVPAAPAAEPEEDAVKSVIESEAKAMDRHDLDAAAAFFADDAKIDSMIAKAKVSKTQWVTAMAAFWRRPGTAVTTEYRGMKVKMSDADHAIVDSEYYLKATNAENRGFSGNSGYLQWRLEKRDGKWLIVETTYK